MTYQPGDILLDKYRIQELVGRGAFAEVYKVTHLSLNVTRAVKVLGRETPGVGSTEFKDYRERFKLEAQLGAKLNTPTPHPNLLQVFDFIQEGDLLILEMEYASGGSLFNCIQKAKDEGQSLPVEETLQMAIDIAEGLSAVHAVDAVHRDLKPTNILLDAQERAKVADLGLAQVPGGPSMRTQLGSMATSHPGTPGYMSPEQERTTKFLTPPSDVYSLGIVLLEILTGRNYLLLKPGTKPASLRQDLPEWFDILLLRMLAKDPAERPWDGTEVSQILSENYQREVQKREEEEQARRAAEEQEVQHREAEIYRISSAFNVALAGGELSRAEELQAEINKMGNEGKSASKELRKQLSQTHLELEKRARKITQIRQKALVSLERMDWQTLERRIAELQELGSEGKSTANDLQKRLARARRTTERKQGWDQLKTRAKLWLPWISGAFSILVLFAGWYLLGSRAEDTDNKQSASQTGASAVLLLTESTGRKITPKPSFTTKTAPPTTPVKSPVTTTSIILKPTPTNTRKPTATSTLSPTVPQDTNKPPASADIGDTWISPIDGMTMVYVPEGKFMMGSVGDEPNFPNYFVPQHTVSLDAFWIDKTEITNAMYIDCVKDSACRPPKDGRSYNRDNYYGIPEFDDYPVLFISWDRAKSYCEWARRRLPTEAEWEKAARGTDGRTYPWGEGIDCSKANYWNCVGDAAPVGSYLDGASPYGALDMAGNVSEWVADWFDLYNDAESPYENPIGPGTGYVKVLRGGHFNGGWRYVRSFERDGIDPRLADEVLSFRCARSP